MGSAARRSALVLADGRTLTYVAVGDPAGRAVLHHHGGLVSAGDIVPLDTAAVSAGVRLIAFDRPGIAGSTPAPGRTVLDGASDAEQLLDHLGIGDTLVMGWSMGGPYALATAHRLRGRVHGTAIVAGAVELDAPALAALNAMDRRFTDLAESHAAVLRAAASGLGGVARFAPGAWVRMAGKGEGAADETALQRDAAVMARAAQDGMTQPQGVVEEYRAWARPWGFAVSDITTPVHVWWGTEDHLIPRDWAVQTAGEASSGRLHVLEGEGHFLLLNHAEDVFDVLLSDDDRDGTAT